MLHPRVPSVAPHLILPIRPLLFCCFSFFASPPPPWLSLSVSGVVPNALLQFISAECHEKAGSLVLESVTQGCSVWLRFEPEVVALSILLLAIGTTTNREDFLERVSLDGRTRVYGVCSSQPVLKSIDTPDTMKQTCVVLSVS